MTKPEPEALPTSRGSTHEISRPPVPDLLLLMSALLLGLAVRAGSLVTVLVLVAMLAVGGVIVITKRHGIPGEGDPTPVDLRILGGVVVFGLLGMVGWSPSTVGPTTGWLEHGPGATFVAIAGLAFVTRKVRTRLRYLVLAVAVAGATAGFGIAHLEAAGDMGLDVYHLHVSAADAMSQGENPYTDAVAVLDRSPNAETGDLITGYVYPPLTMIGYALGDWLTPDARYTSLIAWMVVLSILGYSAVRSLSDRNLYLMMLLASVPGLWLMLRAAWTESFSLMFAVIAMAMWTRSTSSGLGVGSMLASKQYFLVTGPVLVLHRDRGWIKRAAVAALVVVATIVPFLVWDAGALWDSAVAFHTSTEPRADSINLVGLLSLVGVDWAPPAYLPLGLGLLVAFWAARGSTTWRSFAAATAIALAASFLVSSQAFANYWFMVFGLCALALVDHPLTEAASRPRPPRAAPASTR